MPRRHPLAEDCECLAAEDEFVYLAVHAAAHGFVRLMWLYDLKLLCAKYHDDD